MQHSIVPGFGKKVSAILDKCLTGYDFFFLLLSEL